MQQSSITTVYIQFNALQSGEYKVYLLYFIHININNRFGCLFLLVCTECKLEFSLPDART